MDVVVMRPAKGTFNPGKGWQQMGCQLCWKPCWVLAVKATIAKQMGQMFMCPDCAKKLITPRTCPICGQEYSEAPAISRRDNSEICPDCGVREALEDAQWDPAKPNFGNFYKQLYG